ncbi:hypothetical protein ACJVC5_02110 [Peredibacter sp. HCB2-198]|uniref:hypothetical protein n=1 Tax=Peredibacter sp. HCB2-198 TaxID=3383025 RepID=UPI0038B505B9
MKSLMFLVLALVPSLAMAHVKWFSDYSFDAVPLTFAQLNTPTFWGLFLLSVVSLPLMVYLDKLADRSTLYVKTNEFLDRYADNGPLIMRVTMGAVLLMSWQGDSVVAPEIAATSQVWVWFQFALALCLLFKETTILTGLGMIFLYIMCIFSQGLFHMLDYVVYPAVGLYLIFSNLKNERLKNLDLPVLYSGLGFSLCWVAFEKIFYPFWGLSVLAKAPALTMGLPHDFFLISCAFVEFTLGYLLIICLLHRPLAIVITLVFFTTTCFFGKTEVVGHTMLHGALLVFIVKGPGHYYQAPIRYHKAFWLRSLFAAVNFIILFAVLAFPYQKMATEIHAESMAKKVDHPMFEIPAEMPVPTIAVHPMKDPVSGWNLHLQTTNYKFTPESSGLGDKPGEGHAHLFVNGKKVGRVYGEWVHVILPPGKSKVKVVLTTNSHKDYASSGKLIESEIEIEEGREVSVGGHAH